MVGVSSITNNSDSSENPTIGIILMLWAMWVQSAQMIVEEKLIVLQQVNIKVFFLNYQYFFEF